MRIPSLVFSVFISTFLILFQNSHLAAYEFRLFSSSFISNVFPVYHWCIGLCIVCISLQQFFFFNVSHKNVSSMNTNQKSRYTIVFVLVHRPFLPCCVHVHDNRNTKKKKKNNKTSMFRLWHGKMYRIACDASSYWYGLCMCKRWTAHIGIRW